MRHANHKGAIPWAAKLDNAPNSKWVAHWDMRGCTLSVVAPTRKLAMAIAWRALGAAPLPGKRR